MKGEARLGDILKSYLRDIGREDVLELGEIHRKWNEIAGERLSRWSEPASLRGGKLVLLVPAPVWASEIHMATGTLKKKIEEETGIVVDEIRVKTEPGTTSGPAGGGGSKDEQEG